MEPIQSSYSRETKVLALFDFDGTITRKDTLIQFILFTHGPLRFLFGIFWLIPYLILYKLRLYANGKAKQRMLNHFYEGWNYASFKRKGEEFCNAKMPRMIRHTALQQIRWHQKKMHRIIIVSASIEEWVGPWCDSLGIEYLCTRLEVRDNYITGKFSTENCYGIEKVNRVKNTLSLEQYETIYAYGDTRGDKELLEIAHKPYYRHFD